MIVSNQESQVGLSQFLFILVYAFEHPYSKCLLKDLNISWCTSLFQAPHTSSNLNSGQHSKGIFDFQPELYHYNVAYNVGTMFNFPLCGLHPKLPAPLVAKVHWVM